MWYLSYHKRLQSSLPTLSLPLPLPPSPPFPPLLSLLIMTGQPSTSQEEGFHQNLIMLVLDLGLSASRTMRD